MRKLIPVLGLLALALVMAAPASADTIVVFNNTNGCGGSTCFGAVATLTIHPTGGNNYTVTLQVDVSGLTLTTAGIGGVDVKFGAGGLTAASLTSYNGGATTGWTTAVANGLNANGCAVTGGSTFGCSKDNTFLGGGAAIATLPFNGTYTWVWDVTAGAFNPATDAIHVGVLFGSVTQHCSGPPTNRVCTNSFGNDGIISASGLGSPNPPPNNPVPEPSSLALLGTGLVAVAGLIRRRLVG